MNRLPWVFSIVLCITSAAWAHPGGQTISYTRHVRPYLQTHCAPCHYGTQRQGGLSLVSVTDILKGGNHGAAIVPGRASESRLVRLMEHTAEPKMPPIPGAKPLDTRLIRAWIAQGARDDRKAEPNPKSNNETPLSGSTTDRRVTAAAFSPNGRTLAVGGFQTIRLFDSGTGRALGILKGCAGAVTSLAFVPSGRYLLAAGGLPGRSGEVRVFEIPAEAVPLTSAGLPAPVVLRGHDDAINSLAISPNGQWIAAGSYDQRLSLWPFPSKHSGPSRPRYLKDHTDVVYGVAFSPDGKLAASGGGDRTVKIWSVQTGKRLYTLSESTAEVYGVAFSPSGKQIAAGGADRTLRVWNVSTQGGKLVKAAFAHEGPILRVVYARDGRSIVTSGQDRTVKRWDSSTLAERRVYPKQPDWPQAIAISPDERLLAVGRHDGSLAIYDMESGRLIREPIRAAAVTQKPAPDPPNTSLVPGFRPGDNRRRPRKNGPITLTAAALSGISPAGMERGKTTRLTLTGANISDATAVFISGSGVRGRLLSSAPDSNKGILRIEVTAETSADPGIYQLFLQTPRGTTGSVNLAVGAWPETNQAEPNDNLERSQRINIPTTVIGTMDQPGDVDYYTFEARAGQEVVFEILAQPIRSRLQAAMDLRDDAGKVVAQSQFVAGRTDTIFGYRCERAGAYTLRVRDFEGASGSDTHYRLNLAELPYITDLFPFGFARQGLMISVGATGFNLPKPFELNVRASGRFLDPPLGRAGGKTWSAMRIALPAGGKREVIRRSGNTEARNAQPVEIGDVINGRFAADPGVKDSSRFGHYYRFSARKGRTLVLEVAARRAGSRLDSEIEVTDAHGKPVERAALRAVGQTELVLVDRDSASSGLRLQAWDDFRVNDYVLIGREVIQIQRLPAGPDEDVFFRAYRGQRLGFLGTTPEYHSVGDPIYKVEIHPPGSRFSPNGFPLRIIHYRNDDGGPLYGKDSYLEFTPPSDGDYMVRLTDARGQSGEDYPYCLVIREPHPDFEIRVSPEHASIPKAGATVLEVTAERFDGFNSPISLRLENLPPGFVATETTIESGETSAFIQISVDPAAKSLPAGAHEPPGFRVTGRSQAGGKEIIRETGPKPTLGLVTLLPDPDIEVSTDVREVVIRAGQEVYLEARVERRGEFGNRVPVLVQNLPFGVRVTDVGLNGVLITEEEDSRRFTLYAEPWVKPQTRVFYVTGNVEGGVANSARPLILRVLPSATTRR